MKKIVLFVLCFVLASTALATSNMIVKNSHVLRKYFTSDYEPLDLGVDLNENPIILSDVKVRKPLAKKVESIDTLEEFIELTPYELKEQMELDSLRQAKEDSTLQSLYASGDEELQKEDNFLFVMICIMCGLLFAMIIVLSRWKKII